ncbi:unnamed protein product [Mytilus coruscus]|uniref:Uncharacterized protein n=1 Tax=Mytilus coruscus TaxID=42192 RepID=A0A6J8BSG0_MYTCO|nr:unnamed protein product [Mytilus coruscus]
MDFSHHESLDFLNLSEEETTVEKKDTNVSNHSSKPETDSASNCSDANGPDNWQNERRARPVSDNLPIPVEAITQSITEIEPCIRDTALQYFLPEVKKTDGNDYPSASLYQLFVALQGQIRLSDPSVNLLTQPTYVKCRKVLDSVMKKKISRREDISKTNSGGIKDKNIHQRLSKAYENVEYPGRCIVTLFEKYKRFMVIVVMLFVVTKGQQTSNKMSHQRFCMAKSRKLPRALRRNYNGTGKN